MGLGWGLLPARMSWHAPGSSFDALSCPALPCLPLQAVGEAQEQLIPCLWQAVRLWAVGRPVLGVPTLDLRAKCGRAAVGPWHSAPHPPPGQRDLCVCRSPVRAWLQPHAGHWFPFACIPAMEPPRTLLCPSNPYPHPLAFIRQSLPPKPPCPTWGSCSLAACKLQPPVH